MRKIELSCVSMQGWHQIRNLGTMAKPKFEQSHYLLPIASFFFNRQGGIDCPCA